ncbi:hypothetical protein [Aureimonas glaciei]|uniref:Uncharacterized protein n=1 Tax=Aureimonas glaciei TaxID=1776957 RepID=A0A916YH45_9HYPH|nr:hypothetical protein [Aureimonas glaciei]GGD43958.1 hypothetical protein GCM10011335_53230 [Aureimonas glaciei]
MTAADVRQILAAACRTAGSAKAWAAANGCSPSYVAEVLAGTRDPGPKILDGLGVEKVVGYRRVTCPE